MESLENPNSSSPLFIKPLFPKINIILKTAATTGKINGNPKIFINNFLKIKLLRKIDLAIGIANKQAKQEENSACFKVKTKTLIS